jgi:hypothetical protein
MHEPATARLRGNLVACGQNGEAVRPEHGAATGVTVFPDREAQADRRTGSRSEQQERHLSFGQELDEARRHVPFALARGRVALQPGFDGLAQPDLFQLAGVFTLRCFDEARDIGVELDPLHGVGASDSLVDFQGRHIDTLVGRVP